MKQSDPRPTVNRDVLSRFVGQRVRDLRRQRSQTLAELAERSAMSIAMLSRLERGLVSPSLGTLASVAQAFGVPLTAMFRGLDEEHDAVIVRADQGVEILHVGSGQGRRYEDLGVLRGPNRELEPVLVTLTDTDAVFPLFQHPGVELIYMLRGSLEYGYGANRYQLDVGDTMQFHGEIAHGPVKLLAMPVQFLSLKLHRLDEG